MASSNRSGPSERTIAERVRIRLADFVADPVVIALLLALATVMLYWPATGFEFINYDDPHYVIQNTNLQSGLTWAGICWAFSTGHMGYWQPLTWISYMLDATVFGMGPSGFHLTNLMLHSANAVLVFLTFRQLTGAHWPSALVAALFAFHPLQVESVAWVTERKDVLSTFFGLLATLCYAVSVTSGKASSAQTGAAVAEVDSMLVAHHSPRFYWLALTFFTLGLMSKPMLVTLPFVLLLLDYWPLRRFGAPFSPSPPSAIRRLLLEKVPFFTISLTFSVITYLLQRRVGFVRSSNEFPVLDRIGNAAVTYIQYLGKAFWPVNLAFFYPYAHHRPWTAVLPAVVLMTAFSIIAIGMGRMRPFLFTGWFWFVGALVPVIGLVQSGYQAMADRFTYVPLLGLFIIISWGVAEVCTRGRLPRLVAVLIVGLVLAACAARTRNQLGYWQNDGTLFGRAVDVTSNNYLAQYNLGVYLANHGRASEAIIHYREAIRTDPNRTESHLNLGIALENVGQLDDAIKEYREAVKLDPGNFRTHFNLGCVLADQGRRDEAIEQFQEVLRLKPGLAMAQQRLRELGAPAGSKP